MSRTRFSDMQCGVAQALEQVGDWWTLLIVRDAFFGARRFAHFEELGIARNILSNRLRKLVADGILEKRRVEGSSRHEYRLTEKGRDLWIVLTALRLWSDKWVFGRGNEPLVARDQDSGAPLVALRAVGPDGTPVNPRRLAFEAGPGATDADEG